ncbi:MAG: CDP-alcohol phosphatidyltransferase family protein [Treponema sp.]|jgi:CDP-diacylglycerol--serine O-phosphatidyltransferase|nr:CDP-alcohol phosphatidyltransferase family protein [Treponema sp.]
MNKLNNEEKIALRGRRKRRRLKYIAVLPSLVTLMNGVCGFASILLASQGPDMVWRPLLLPKTNISYFALAGYMIFFGMVADVLDGHLARISKSTSSFGAQLDSLCDVITFGVAPAFLMLKLVQAHLHYFQFVNNQPAALSGRVVFLIAILYVMCAIIRLARFNVETSVEDSHLSFAGLPSPPAAGTIVSLVIFQQDLLPKITKWPTEFINASGFAAVWALPIITLMAGILMVTRIPYPHIVNRLLRGKKQFSTFLLVVFTVLLIIWNIQLAMALGFCVFVVYGLVHFIITRIIRSIKKENKTETPQPPGQQET